MESNWTIKNLKLVTIQVDLKESQRQENGKYQVLFKGDELFVDWSSFRFEIPYTDFYLNEIDNLLYLPQIKALTIVVHGEQ